MSVKSAARCSLGAGFLNSVDAFPERPALEVDGDTLSYSDLHKRAVSIAGAIQANSSPSDSLLTAVLAHRSTTAYSGILGALLAGHGYVPLNPNFPAERTRTMLVSSGAHIIVCGNEALPILGEILEDVERPLVILLPASADVAELQMQFSRHQMLGADDLADASWEEKSPDLSATAYLLFTSGSTGIPKGVPINHSNIRHFLDVVTNRYDLSQHDRFSQMFELVFDLSLFDMFVTWECGACLCVPSKDDVKVPARYIRESGITVWFSVPSLALHMSQMRMLRGDPFSKLRISLFCGEALLAEIASAWAVAAPNSIVENLYGPTEVTLACTAYRWDQESGPADSGQGLVPIGSPFPGLDCLIADDDLREVGRGESGELLMAGPQVAPGYWNDEEKTNAAFVTPPGKKQIFYRTGDLVRMSDNGSTIKYMGRLDHQIKIRGNRVELGEIEAKLREVADADIAVAVGWPVSASGADGICAFLQTASGSPDSQTLRASLGDHLPIHMIPKEIRFLDTLPLNANGKVDRKALLSLLESERQGGRTASSPTPKPSSRSNGQTGRGIVILGSPRSGTTLLRRVLDSHPSIACPGETCVLSAAARFLHAETVSDGLQFGVLNGLAFAGFEPEQTLERLRKFIFGFHEEYAQKIGKSRWAEKTAIDVFHLAEIEQLCGDDVQFICVTRHGLDVACSLREFSDRGYTYLSELHDYVRRYPRPLEAFAHAWCDATEAVLDFQQRHPQNSLLVRYEDFVAEPVEQGRRLFEFLNEDWDEKILKNALSKSDSLGLGDWKAHSSNSIGSESISRWKSLPPGIISRLAAICNRVLERSGYAPVRLQPEVSQADARRRYELALSMDLGSDKPKVSE